MNATHATSSHADAINACRLMDTLISTPHWQQSVFTDSIQLFPNSLLTQAKHSQAAQDPEQRTLGQILSDLQGLFDSAQQELGHFSAKDPGMATSSPSLRLDAAGLTALNKATKHLLRTIDAFQHVYDQDISSRLQHYQQQQQQQQTELQDTVPGLGPEARKLNETQRSLREMLDTIRDIRGAVASVTEPPSQTQKTLLDAKRGLVRGSDDSDVQTMLERLAMAATLERTLQRINA
ncbi:hypothetical protein BGZ70_008155 [Mortierella alpina]|uniref:Uncharacterized protein n=1 Tax=Mortierella alpina TaxID=64518 RepID=A0A9P6J4K3_MORAP|nr:hypothetical protein BGZ70_008155 [Mortierella alpina]